MNIGSNWINELAEFYKYCYDIYDDNKKDILLPKKNRWTCYFRPYLIEGRVIHSVHAKLFKKNGLEFCQFKNCLLVSLQNYLNYIKKSSVIENLINQIIFLQEAELVEIIESNHTMFPNKKNT